MPEIVRITYAGGAHTEFVAEAGAVTEVNDIGGKPPLGALFSTVASDNAEVVPPTAPRGPETMWSTEVPPDRSDTGLDADPGPDADTATYDGDLLDDTPPPFSSRSAFSAEPRTSDPRAEDPWVDARQDGSNVPGGSFHLDDGPFSAEPVPHDDDVIDSGDLFDPLDDDSAAGWSSTPTSSVFSNGAASADRPGSNGAGSYGAGSFGVDRPAGTTADDSPWTVVGDDWGSAGPARRSAAAEPVAPRAEPSRPRDAAPSAGRHLDGSDDVTPDPHGLEAAVERLSAVDQERTAVPIAVCGALLEPDEAVVGVVTGQMLGRPAAVMVTDRRVVVANDRRWQPLVDVYRIDSKLVVRGRHDRHVAALSFADTDRLSMIDGIFEVELAIELAERIRDTDPID